LVIKVVLQPQTKERMCVVGGSITLKINHWGDSSSSCKFFDQGRLPMTA
jgi:hypothetical protein